MTATHSVPLGMHRNIQRPGQERAERRARYLCSSGFQSRESFTEPTARAGGRKEAEMQPDSIPCRSPASTPGF